MYFKSNYSNYAIVAYKIGRARSFMLWRRLNNDRHPIVERQNIVAHLARRKKVINLYSQQTIIYKLHHDLEYDFRC